MDIQVTIKQILPEQRGQGKNGEWVRYSFVGKTIEQYQKTVKFDVLGQERWNKMKAYLALESTVKVSFDIESREYKGKYYTTLNAFSVYAGNVQQPQQAPQQHASAPQQTSIDEMPF